MKTLFTLVVTLLIGVTALAQKSGPNVKVEVYKMGIVLDDSSLVPVASEQVESAKEGLIARVYPYRNYRVMKALLFITIRSIPKLT